MSGATENRAAVFTSQPQDVEVYRDGAWRPGSLLGWRHDDAGSCQVWVRVVAGGVESTAWTDLESLRLPQPAPERRLSVAPAPSAAPDPSATQALPLFDPSATRELERVQDAGSTTGRRRARELPGSRALSAAARASLAVSVAEPAGTPRVEAEGPERAAAPGRHRAPAAAGRHRAADTGVFPAVSAAPPAEAGVSRPVAVEDARLVKPSMSWVAPAEMDGDLLTRPMRLRDAMANAAVPQPRAARWDARLGGA